MDFDLASYAAQMDPAQRQAYMVQALRARQAAQGQEAIAAANERAHSMDNMSVVSQLANNPALAQAAGTAQKLQLSRHKPVQMGMQGFLMPESGEFVESPVYKDEKEAGRQLQRDTAAQRSDDKRFTLRQTMEQREMLTRMLEEGRNERSASDRVLRRALADIAGGRAQDRLDAQGDHDLNTNIAKLGNSATKAQLPRLMTNSRDLLAVLNKYAGKDDIPGLNARDMMAAQMPFGDRLLNDEAKTTISAVKGITNALMRADAGLSQTAQESLRQQMETFDKSTSSAKTRALILRKHILPLINETRSAVLGTAAQNVRDTYRQRQSETGGDAAWMDDLDLTDPEEALINKYLKPKAKGK